MNRVAAQSLESPFRRFTRDEWAQLRADTQLTLTIDDLRKLQSTHDPISLDEVVAIYLPLSRLLALYVAATQGLFKATQRFLGATDGKVPYIIGIAGSVAAGKSTTARVLQALLTRWPNTPKVQLVTTDGFLHPNAELIRQGIMDRKGFPESYDGTALHPLSLRGQGGTAQRRRSGLFAYHLRHREGRIGHRRPARHSHLRGDQRSVAEPAARDGKEIPFVSDFFDFSIFLDADDALLEQWYIDRFMGLRTTAFRDPRSYFRQYADLDDAEAEATARSIWRRINLVNLHENILPTRPRADLLLTKGRKPPDRRSGLEEALSVMRRCARRLRCPSQPSDSRARAGQDARGLSRRGPRACRRARGGRSGARRRSRQRRRPHVADREAGPCALLPFRHDPFDRQFRARSRRARGRADQERQSRRDRARRADRLDREGQHLRQRCWPRRSIATTTHSRASSRRAIANQIEKLLAGQGYPAEFAHHLKPWFLAILTALPACEAKREALDLPEVDQFLAQTAKDSGVKVVAFETPQEQLDAIATMRPEVAATLLARRRPRAGLERRPLCNDAASSIGRADRRKSCPISDAVGGLSEAERSAQDEFMRVLLVDRNAVMAERAAPLLASGGAFIAVGALHLTGKDGLIERFRADGYKVTKVW